MIDDRPDPIEQSSNQALADVLPDTVKQSLLLALTKSAWLGVLIALGIFAVCYPASKRLKFDRSIASMFDPDDPTLAGYVQLQNEFGGNAIAMVVYQDDELWTDDGIQRNLELTARSANIDGVAGVLSPSVLNGAVRQIRPGSLFSSGAPILNQRDPVSRGFDLMFAGYTHSLDHNHGVVVAMLDPQNVQAGIKGLQSLVGEIQSQPDQRFQDIVLIGEPVLVEQAFDLIERDGAWLASLTIALLSMVVLLSLLDLRLVLLSILVIGWSVTVTKACLFALGINLSLVSTILTAVTTVIAVTAVLHLGVRFRIARGRGRRLNPAMTTAIVFLAIPILLTCLTDAAGFAALTASRILPVRQFGWMIAIAATCVFIAIALFAPLVLRIPAPKSFTGMANSIRAKFLHPFGRSIRKSAWLLSRTAIDHAKVVLLIVLAAFAILPYAMSKLETETTFLNNFESDSDLVAAYRRVENDLGGAGVWDVILEAPPKLNNDYLKEVRRLEYELRKIEIDGVKLTKVISLADADRVLKRVPLLRRLTQLRLEGMRTTMPEFYGAMLTEPSSEQTGDLQTSRRIRIMLRSEEEIESDQKIRLILAVEETVQASEIGEGAKVTGYYVLMARLIDQLVTDGWRCCHASATLVWVVLILGGRSIKRATVALLVNLLPAFLVIALVGMFGGKVNMGSAMIAAVSIGLSIDGSVHFLTAYRRKRKRGHSPGRAAEYAAANIGVPMVLATAALVVGFGGLVTSEFVPTSTFGGLVAATLAIGTFVNLTILPALIALIDRRQTHPE